MQSLKLFTKDDATIVKVEQLFVLSPFNYSDKQNRIVSLRLLILKCGNFTSEVCSADL